MAFGYLRNVLIIVYKVTAIYFRVTVMGQRALRSAGLADRT
jgi:hypothetical protein